MSKIKDRLSKFQDIIRGSNDHHATQEVTLVAVSKTKPEEDLMEAYETGHRDFGENKIQEMTTKSESLPKDIRWHMIGHTQRNKVKYMAPYVHLIHSVDSPRLLKEINKQAAKNDRVIDCLLQVHIAEESSKYGFDEQELIQLMEDELFKEYQHVQIKGLMGMATFTDDEEQVRKEFKSLKAMFDRVKDRGLLDRRHDFTELSMGMTGDYEIALEEGSTMLRIGSAIFGARD
ncbi:YggS family pyridoxal phosphate-dependent enzyme [Nonlabens xiamenensis]|uniref:YggS family pyridoxal phosphate-dependent enzyme n=1 Tax=Nonlabens xiamenensis TaxID=2341043 RepID=UPI000F60804A|nr:YggS family pyridoxal phosphate-dependent enzyme [Nonlabens xiamenensis]